MSPKDQSDTPLVTSIYIPNHCLQGEDLPAHILWTGKGRVKVQVVIPTELRLKQLFNVSPKKSDGVRSGMLTVSGFETPGYLGFLFQAGRLSDARKVAKVRFVITSSGGGILRSTEREVVLFRPLLRSVDTPAVTDVMVSDAGRGRLTKRLALSNAGDGTAIVGVEASSDGHDLVGIPSGVTEFITKYKADVIAGFTKSKDDFPQFGRLLDQFSGFVREPPVFDQSTQRSLRATFNTAQRAYEKDRSFLSRILEVVLGAYFRNLRLMTEVESFLDYVNSIGTGRVVISNALDVIRVEKGNTQVSLTLRIADVGLNAYPPIQLGPFTVSSTHAAEIPIHCLFEWQVPKSGLERSLGA